MYDILVYLFENCQQADLAYDRERVARKLSAAGFEDCCHGVRTEETSNWV